MNKKTQVVVASAVILAVAAGGWISFRMHRQTKSFEMSTYAMGSYFEQTVYGDKAQEAAKEAAESVSRLEGEISWKISDSDIAHVDRDAGKGWTSIHPEAASLLRLSLDIAKRSEGAYDPTVLPLSSLWNFDGDVRKVPAAAAIRKAVTRVGYQNLQVRTGESAAALRNSGMGIDLGGIGKGAACDDAVAAYRSAGAVSGIISGGGSSIGLFGKKPDGSPWVIAVRDPNTPNSNANAMGELRLGPGFVSTSGIYEKSFQQNGVTYHHLLNPKTGYPENNGLVSVTVVADQGALSDGLSTACFVLGKERGRELLRHYGADAVMIDRANRVYVTDNLKGRFKITNSKYEYASF